MAKTKEDNLKENQSSLIKNNKKGKQETAIKKPIDVQEITKWSTK